MKNMSYGETIGFYLVDQNAKMESCYLAKTAMGSDVVRVKYTMSEDIAEKKEIYPKRILQIMIKRVDGDFTCDVTSFGDIKQLIEEETK